jgi:hypothetical protein
VLLYGLVIVVMVGTEKSKHIFFFTRNAQSADRLEWMKKEAPKRE